VFVFYGFVEYFYGVVSCSAARRSFAAYDAWITYAADIYLVFEVVVVAEEFSSDFCDAVHCSWD